MASSPGVFPTTCWTLVNRVRDDNAAVRQAALDELCRAYWLPLYAFARRSGFDPPDAEDAVQDFFIGALQRDLLARADEQVGKLRNLLCIAFKRHLNHRRRHEQALRRGGGVEHVPLLPRDAEERYLSVAGESLESPDQIFHRQWARNLVERAQQALRSWYEREGKGALFERLSAYLPCDSVEAANGEEPLEDRAGMSVDTFRIARHRMRKRLRECIRSEVRETTQSTDPVLIEAEIRELLQALSA